MSFRNNKGNISVFAFMVIAMIALSIGSVMMSNFSVYQLSKSYHVLRERLLIKKMLFQMTEEVVLSQYELSDIGSELDLKAALKKEVDSITAKTGLAIDAFELLENHLRPVHRPFSEGSFAFESGYTALSPRISRYLNQGSYVNCGQAIFLYNIHGCTYSIKATGYGVALSNFNLTQYDLPLSFGNGIRLKDGKLYTMDEEGNEIDVNTSVKGDINYKNRKDVSILCNAYEWLWKGDYLDKLARASVKHFVLDIPYSGELQDNGITVVNQKEVTLDLEKIDFDVVTLADPLGEGVIKFLPSVASEKPLVIICYNNLKFNKKTIVEVDKSFKRPIVFFVLNTEVVFQNDPQVSGAFFLDSNSKARGGLTLDGHFSCYRGSNFLDMLKVKFERTEAIKTKLASMAPHVFLTDVSLMEVK